MLDSDWERIAELMEQYIDLPLGMVDASVVALAERRGLEDPCSAVTTYDITSKLWTDSAASADDRRVRSGQWRSAEPVPWPGIPASVALDRGSGGGRDSAEDSGLDREQPGGEDPGEGIIL